jgi:hypothetical protein
VWYSNYSWDFLKPGVGENRPNQPSNLSVDWWLSCSPYIRDAQLRFENGDDIDQIKMDSLQKHSHILLGGRDWEWGDEIA